MRFPISAFMLIGIVPLVAACPVEGTLGDRGDEATSTGVSEAATGGESSSAGSETGEHDECTPLMQDDACTTCTKDQCCQELHECTVAGQPCLCVFACLLEGHSLAACENDCGSMDDGTAQHYFDCVHANCATACMP